MNRRMWVGSSLGLACVLTVASAAWAQAEREGGMRPGPDGPGMAMAGPGGMEPGGPPPAEGCGPAMGPRGAGGPGLPMGGPRSLDWERLGLSDAQQRRLDDLRDVEQRKVIRLEADLRIAELDLRRLVAGELPNLQTVGAQVDRIADLRAGILKARLATELGLRGILTPDQRARMRQLGPGPRREAGRPAAWGEDRRHGGGQPGGSGREGGRNLQSRPANGARPAAGRSVERMPAAPRDGRPGPGAGGAPEGPGPSGDENPAPPDESPAAMDSEGL